MTRARVPAPGPRGPAAPAPPGAIRASASLYLRGPAEGVEALRRGDPALGRVIERVGAFSLRRSPLIPFAFLARAIAHQQLTARAAAPILARVKAAAGPGPLTPAGVLAAGPAALRAAGLSAAKTASLLDLATRAASGELPDLRRLHAMDDEEIVEQLTVVRGIGRWTVEMLLVFCLGRPDVLPVTDYGVRKGFARAFTRGRLPAPAEVLRRGERWRPWRSVASWYLWRVLELPQPGPRF
ncbi:MAG TPA: DNA-3-methyladenine glycosylase 2 family protein [Gemmatimonadota bacterium]